MDCLILTGKDRVCIQLHRGNAYAVQLLGCILTVMDSMITEYPVFSTSPCSLTFLTDVVQCSVGG